MKGMILAVWIGTSLFFSGAAIGQPCMTRSCAAVRAPGLARQVPIVTSERVGTPRAKLTGRRDCVGLPSRASTPVTDQGAPLSLVTADLPHWA